MPNATDQTAMLQFRNRFPALNNIFHGKKAVFFDGPGGTQMCDLSINRMTDYIKGGMANRHAVSPTSLMTEDILAQAREEVAALVNGFKDGVFFGNNMTSLAYSISRMFARDWKVGDEIVITEMDHSANVDTWVQAADEKGAKVRTIPVDVSSLTLDTSVIDTAINENTKAVFLGLASNGVGTINDLKPFIKAAKQAGALTVVDAVQAIPHMAVDQRELGVDLILGSGYKVFGPHIGFGSMEPSLLKKYTPFKIKPADDEPPSSMETGTQNHEGIAGIIGAIEFIASFGNGKTKREKIVNAYQSFESHEHHMTSFLKEELAKIEKVKLFTPDSNIPSTPIISFIMEDTSSNTVSKYFAEEHSIFIANGDFYAYQLARRLDVMKYDGWIRIGLSPYNTMDECERFVKGILKFVNP